MSKDAANPESRPGIRVVMIIAMAIAALVPPFFWVVERRVGRAAPEPIITIAAEA